MTALDLTLEQGLLLILIGAALIEILLPISRHLCEDERACPLCNVDQVEHDGLW